ncbi:allene oxide synthase-like [Papaver somniferum]|uniref:allene oxide synthase-like n=1 Tax=Papaver somniferum TaxID=3469 RepID=UPI000E703923|nr:allene oxide synthase-like [Papaver somniferum]
MSVKSPLLDNPAVSSTSRSSGQGLRKIPGDYGLPFFGPLFDRFSFFYCQGPEKYFTYRMQKYQSTVFRANMPPGPFISSNSKVVVLLDSKSFPILFDGSKVEKKDIFTGTYMPSTKLTGGYRVLSYLDPSEPNHSKLKQLFLSLIHSRSEFIIPEFRKSFGELFDTIDSDLAAKGKVNFDAPTGGLNEKACFDFLARSWLSTNPADTELGDGAPSRIIPWFLFTVAPIAPLGLPCFIEDPLLHTIRLPPCLVKRGYQELYNFFYINGGGILDEGEKMGIKRDEVCHNLLFFVCFNSFTGMKAHFPNIIKWISRLDLREDWKNAPKLGAMLEICPNSNISFRIQGLGFKIQDSRFRVQELAHAELTEISNSGAVFQLFLTLGQFSKIALQIGAVSQFSLDLKIQKQLIDEIRSAVKSNEGKVTMKAIEEMPLVKSVIFEILRLDPAAPYQYAKAKTDLVIESHESTFEVKQGEMLFGYQPIVTKDPKVFERAEEFVADRFVGVEGEKLLKYVVWSNGPETEDPMVDNKQCAGKNLVELFSRLLVVELFIRYDSFKVELGSSLLCPQVTFTSLTKATAEG